MVWHIIPANYTFPVQCRVHGTGAVEPNNPTHRVHSSTKKVPTVWSRVRLIISSVSCPNESQQFHPDKLCMAQHLYSLPIIRNVPAATQSSVVYDGWMRCKFKEDNSPNTYLPGKRIWSCTGRISLRWVMWITSKSTNRTRVFVICDWTDEVVKHWSCLDIVPILWTNNAWLCS